MSPKYTTTIERAALAIPEQRRDLHITQAELARVSGVSRSTVQKIEAGRAVEPRLVLDLASSLLLLELYGALQPRPTQPHSMAWEISQEISHA